jgi:hypothetical protein
LLVVGCSALSTGELTIVLDWAGRCERALELQLLLPAPLAPGFAWAGRVRTYTPRGGEGAVREMVTALCEARPDLVVIADLLLFHSAPYELGAPLDGFLHEALAGGPVAALDLYDWDRRGRALECYGARRFAGVSPLPAPLLRLLPTPYLASAASTPGHGRYAMMQDAGPRSDAERAATRRDLGLDGGKVVLALTSPWQHVAQFLAGAEGVTRFFPALMLRLLDLSAQQVGGAVTLVHVGPAAINVPDDVRSLRYRHVAQMPPSEFKRLLGAADLLLSPNCIASSVLRAASRRVPCAALWASADVGEPPPRPARTAPQRALAAYLDRACPAYGFLVWPLGLRQALGEILTDNPYRDVQAYFDILDADTAVDGLAAALTDPSVRDRIGGGQQRYFDVLRTMDSPEEALRQMLDGRS